MFPRIVPKKKQNNGRPKQRGREKTV